MSIPRSLPKSIILLSLLLILFPSFHTEDIFNPQDLYNIPLESIDVQEDISSLEPSRLLSSYPNLRIQGNFDNLDSAPASYKAYIQNDLVPPVISWFQAAISIKYPVTTSIKLASSVTSLCGVSTPSELFTGVEADLFVLFNSKLYSTSTVASSKVCYLSSGTRRPLVVTSIFNRNILVAANGDVLVHEKNIYLTIHEMMHNLAFSSDLFPYFMDENGKVRTGHVKSVTYYGKTTKVIDVPPLTEKLRKFFGCSSLEGAYLENDGNDGTTNSHFERKIFVYETMSSGVIYSRRVSQFSLALLEGSGWYVPDYDYAEPYHFGQGQGCNFIFGSCAKAATEFASEFCSGTSTRGCTPFGDGAGKCFKDTLTEGCGYIMPDKAYSCENADASANARLSSLQVYGRGLGSKCFTGTLNSKSTTSKTNFCFKYTCSGSGSTTKLTVKVGTKSVVCSKAGAKTVSGYYGSINCPDPLSFCNTIGKPYCPRNCMGRGTCVKNKCQCKSGFTGVDCALNA